MWCRGCHWPPCRQSRTGKGHRGKKALAADGEDVAVRELEGLLPPNNTMLLKRSLRMSASHFKIDRNVVSWMPLASMPTKLNWKRTGQRKRSPPTVMKLPSASSKVTSLLELSEASFISVSKSSANLTKSAQNAVEMSPWRRVRRLARRNKLKTTKRTRKNRTKTSVDQTGN